MGEPVEPIADTVSEFLANNSNALSKRGSVVLENVSVTGAGRGVQAAPNVLTTIKSWLNPIAYIRQHGFSRTLLHNFSGTISKGEMVLVIGKPGSGCTTFLKTLTGMRDEYKDTTGTITYGGRPDDDKDQDPVKLTFCAEEDEHLPKLTVFETLRFAVRSIWNPKTSKETIDTCVRTLAKLVGLSHVLNTNVGSAAVRGVSGGERRRVTLAEAIATCPDVLCLDNPTHGLDSSTALEFVEMMHEYTRQRACATVMSIYQGSNLMVPLFDKAVVIKGGREIFYGKMSEAKQYFESLGFVCPERTTTMDFLNSMTAEAAIRHVREGYESKVPIAPEEFEQAFRQTKYYQIIAESIAHKKSQPNPVGSKQHVYSLPLYHQVYECAFRQYRVLVTSWDALAVEALCIIVQSLILGTLFRDQARATKSFFMLASSLFYSTLVPALQSMSEFGNTFAQRSLVIRQKRYRFYRPMAYALGLVATDAIWKIVAIAYNIPLYFLTGFQDNAASFFTWFATVYIEHLALSMVFRAIAIFSPSVGTAILPVGIMFNMFVLYTGLYVPGPQMQAWLFWLKYLNPLYYAFESVMINEFADLTYQCSPSDLAPSGLEYRSVANQVCAVPGSVPGEGTVSGISYLQAQYGFEASHLWRNFGINCGIFVFMAVVTGIGMELHKEPAGRLATVFYRAEPKDIVSEKSSTTSDTEKGAIEDTPPKTLGVVTTRRTNQDSQLIGQALAWQNICWDLKLDGENKRFLDNINGFVDVGQLTALMGVSGAGKTTLLNALAGRLNEGTLSGDLFLGGKPLPKTFSRYMGYVQQADIHLPTQTVREALQMTAGLRRGHCVSLEEKNAYVETVIEMLEMEDIAEALIGVPGAGLNLEQRKRVTIGAEMAAKPDIIFLDEPSSGLDGQSAVTIIQLLRKLANSGQTILCTIHQPAADLVEIFDHLILLVNGGRVAYDGPLGSKCATALDYFTTSGGRIVEPHENPADYFLETVGAGSRSKATEDWSRIWQSSEAWSKRSIQINELITTSNESSAEPLDSEGTYAAPYWLQLTTVLRRTWLYYWREPDYFVSKLLMNVGNSLLNSLSYLQSGDNQRGAYNRVFSSFMSLIVGPPLGLQVAPRFTSLRDIFIQREKDSLTYHWSIFVISAIIIELPYVIVTSGVYWLLWYFPVGLFSESSRSGYNFLMYELFAIFATSLAQFTSSLMPSLEATFAANGFFFMFCNTFAGTLSPKSVTPKGWRWFYNVSPLYYLGGGLTTDVLEGLEIKCDLSEVSIFQPPNGSTCATYAADFLQTATGYIMEANSTSDCQYCRYKDGQSYYIQYGYDFANRYKNFGIFIGFIAFNYTMVIALTWLTKIHKWKKRT